MTAHRIGKIDALMCIIITSTSLWTVNSSLNRLEIKCTLIYTYIFVY